MIFSNDPKTMIANVFMDPNIRRPDNERPFLYLLRRDLQELYGKESSARNSDDLKAPLLAANGIMIGFEMLTKMRFGSQKHKINYRDGGEIEQFLQQCAGLDVKNADALTQFRHAVTHGYHLATKKWLSSSESIDYSFELKDDVRDYESVVDMGSHHFRVNFWPLKELFLESIKNYYAIVEANVDLQGKLDCALRFMGTCEVTI